MWYIYTMEYYTAEKNNDIMKFADKWMELENVILSQVPHEQECAMPQRLLGRVNEETHAQNFAQCLARRKPWRKLRVKTETKLRLPNIVQKPNTGHGYKHGHGSSFSDKYLETCD
ncbi:hypothetical protein STEG23_004387 [Scotinomys teguina]